MFAEAYKRAFGVLKSKPIRLWGLSLLVGFISVISILFSLGFLPIGIAFVMVIQCGMTKVYLDGLKAAKSTRIRFLKAANPANPSSALPAVWLGSPCGK